MGIRQNTILTKRPFAIFHVQQTPTRPVEETLLTVFIMVSDEDSFTLYTFGSSYASSILYSVFIIADLCNYDFIASAM